jgi:hypothetical protein
MGEAKPSKEEIRELEVALEKRAGYLSEAGTPDEYIEHTTQFIRVAMYTILKLMAEHEIDQGRKLTKRETTGALTWMVAYTTKHTLKEVA